MDELEGIPLEMDLAVQRWTTDFVIVARKDPSLATDETGLHAWFAMVYLDGRNNCIEERKGQLAEYGNRLDEMAGMLEASSRKFRKLQLRFAVTCTLWAALAICLVVLLCMHA